MPNFTGVMARRALHVVVLGVERARSARGGRRSRSIGRARSQIVRSRSACRHRLPVRRGLPGLVEVALAQRRRVDAERGRDPAEDVLDDEHALRPAEAAERGLRRLVRLRDPPVRRAVRDPVGVVDVAERAAETGSERSRLQPPSETSVASQREDAAVVVEPRLPRDVERMPLAGHRDVLRAVEPQPHGPAREHRAERGDRREPVRLHLLAAEAAAHAQRLHGDAGCSAGRARARRSPASRTGAA